MARHRCILGSTHIHEQYMQGTVLRSESVELWRHPCVGCHCWCLWYYEPPHRAACFVSALHPCIRHHTHHKASCAAFDSPNGRMFVACAQAVCIHACIWLALGLRTGTGIASEGWASAFVQLAGLCCTVGSHQGEGGCWLTGIAHPRGTAFVPLASRCNSAAMASAYCAGCSCYGCGPSGRITGVHLAM